jgi:hypothetical protein
VKKPRRERPKKRAQQAWRRRCHQGTYGKKYSLGFFGYAAFKDCTSLVTVNIAPINVNGGMGSSHTLIIAPDSALCHRLHSGRRVHEEFLVFWRYAYSANCQSQAVYGVFASRFSVCGGDLKGGD